MARRADKEKARKLRKQGKSYSEIRQLIGVGKGTLSAWLSDMPLSSEQMRKLRDLNPRRIESFRATMQRKRNTRLEKTYNEARKDIGELSRRDLFIAGLYLYWGEGTKSARGRVELTNTNPAMVRQFLEWVDLLGVPKSKIRIRLHLYSDQNFQKESMYWSKKLKVPMRQFKKPYVKESLRTGLTYKVGHGHGTCVAHFADMTLWEYITMALKRMHELHDRP